MPSSRKNGVVVHHLEDGCSLRLRFIHEDDGLLARLHDAGMLFGATGVVREERGLMIRMPFPLAAEQFVGLVAISPEMTMVGEA